MNKPWSKIRQMLEEDFLCTSLKGRVRYFNTRYHRAHDDGGRISILVDEIERLSLPHETEYKISDAVCRLPRSGQSLSACYAAVEADFREQGIFHPADFGRALDIYFSLPINEALCHADSLVRMLAVLDRRVGKRTLAKLRPQIDSQPEWLRYFYRLRLESERL